MDFLTNLRLRRQLQLMALAFVVPALFALGMILHSEGVAIRNADRELVGADYIRNIFAADLILNRYFVDPSQDLKEGFTKAAAMIGSAASQAADLGLSEQHAAMTKAWADFIAAPDIAKGDAAMATIDSSLRMAGDASGLILDPELASYYLMDTMVVRLTTLVDNAGTMGRKFRESGDSGALVYEDQLDLRRTAALADNDLATISSSLETAATHARQSEVSDSLKPLNQQLQDSVKALLTTTDQMAQLPDVAMMMAMNKDPTRIKLRKPQIATQRSVALGALDGIETVFSNTYSAFVTEITLRLRQSYLTASGSIGLTVGLFALTTWVVLRHASRQLSRPLGELRDCFERLAKGDEDVHIPPSSRRDEVGDIMRAAASLRDAVGRAFTLQGMVEGMPISLMTCDPQTFAITYLNASCRKTMKLVESALPCPVSQLEGQPLRLFHPHNADHIQKIISDPSRLPFSSDIMIGQEHMHLEISPVYNAAGRYVRTMLSWEVVTRQKQMANLFMESMEGVIDDAGAVQSAAEQLQDIARKSGEGIRTADQAVEEISSLIGDLANTSEELSRSIREISHRLQDANQQTLSGVSLANESISAVDGLARVAEEIGGVVGLITDIANQTNLLSLNATIEAARAGDAGKGFAVVATEVKTLAGETARATETIRQRIESLRAVSQSVVTSISRVTDSISTVNGIVATLSAAVEEQTAATGDIARKINQTAGQANTAAGDLRQVSSSAEETETEANALLSISSRLQSRSENLGQEWSRFVSG
ncbi:methyl-accepting chemotaxis protein [Novispirillum itersonii]|uniref:Methyl-accepting chemotaxis protein n=1 Tax=Novispirillum itersonii TaxID=189 RepID=A0A7W9ZDZ4_NOVIT|nr:HAMP domain-containing methyl-accepting chemotaxis protein [Novispirillum itersonii]MBB6209635.1 methyl-accepting chemotaxis protein [Novispirillum itersonii]